jgi:hypothetical protein
MLTGEFNCQVRDDEIIVSLPATRYYYKLASSAQLLAKRIADKDDPRTAMTVSEFLARLEARQRQSEGVGVDRLARSAPACAFQSGVLFSPSNRKQVVYALLCLAYGRVAGGK